MTDKIALVLHADADETYAAALAVALAPMRAIATSLAKARELTFGAGARCVVVWTPAAVEDCAKQLSATAGVGDAAICLPSEVVAICLRGAAVADAFKPGTRVLIGSENPREDALIIRDALAQLENFNADAPGDGRSKSYRAAMDGGHKPGFSDKPNPAAKLMARSAFGMAATIAVVAFASQYIGSRARATAATSDDLAVAASTEPDHGLVDEARAEGEEAALSTASSEAEAPAPIHEVQRPVARLASSAASLPEPSLSGESPVSETGFHALTTNEVTAPLLSSASSASDAQLVFESSPNPAANEAGQESLMDTSEGADPQSEQSASPMPKKAPERASHDAARASERAPADRAGKHQSVETT